MIVLVVLDHGGLRVAKSVGDRTGISGLLFGFLCDRELGCFVIIVYVIPLWETIRFCPHARVPRRRLIDVFVEGDIIILIIMQFGFKLLQQTQGMIYLLVHLRTCLFMPVVGIHTHGSSALINKFRVSILLIYCRTNSKLYTHFHSSLSPLLLSLSFSDFAFNFTSSILSLAGPSGSISNAFSYKYSAFE